MDSYVNARDSARLAQKTLVYVQAVDVITNYSPSCPAQSRDLFRSLLQVPSLTKTKRLPAFCLLHVGMEMRLTTTLDQPYAVQDATATVLEIHYAEHDAAAQQYMRSAAQAISSHSRSRGLVCAPALICLARLKSVVIAGTRHTEI